MITGCTLLCTYEGGQETEPFPSTYTEVDIARMLLKKTVIQKIAPADPVCVFIKVEGGPEYEGFPSTE